MDASVGYSGQSLLFVDGQLLGPVPCLAISQELGDAGVLLCHSDADWAVLAVAHYLSVHDAKNRAERIYPGVSGCWLDAHVTEKEAREYLDQLWAGQNCSFCGKRPDMVDRMIQKGSAWICDACVAELHQMLQRDSGES